MTANEDPRHEAQMKRLSKFLSLVLRHRPERFPIRMDAEGYANLHEVMQILHGLPNFRWANRADVDAVVAAGDPPRFEITGSRIRALYGHTALRPTYETVVPPPLLYHGTSAEALEPILQEGLRPTEQSYVRLAVTADAARSSALRATLEPIILRIDAAAAHAAGSTFYQPTETVYLSEAIAPQFITRES